MPADPSDNGTTGTALQWNAVLSNSKGREAENHLIIQYTSNKTGARLPAPYLITSYTRFHPPSPLTPQWQLPTTAAKVSAFLQSKFPSKNVTKFHAGKSAAPKTGVAILEYLNRNIRNATPKPQHHDRNTTTAPPQSTPIMHSSKRLAFWSYQPYTYSSFLFFFHFENIKHQSWGRCENTETYTCKPSVSMPAVKGSRKIKPGVGRKKIGCGKSRSKTEPPK